MFLAPKCFFFATLFVHILADCRRQLEEYQSALKEDKYWAVQMLDASAKLPSGLLSGNVVTLGSFDQCLSVESELVKGKYCFGSVKVHVSKDESKAEDTIISWGLCVPDQCLGEEMEVDPSMFLNSNVTSSFHEDLCQTLDSYDSHLTPAAIVTISLLSFLFSLILISTIYETVRNQTKKPVIEILTAFSIVRNTKQLLATTKSKEQISCLNGLRVLSLLWIILLHEFAIYNDGPSVNNNARDAWLTSAVSFYVLGGTFAVDTFFVLGGLLVGYNYQKAIEKKLHFKPIHFYLHRILRIVPALAMVVLISATLLQYLGSGPYWPYLVSSFQEPCQKYWWSAILLVQNYVNVQNMCAGHTWYLNVDMQLYIISPAILLLCNKKRSLAIALTGILILLSTAASFAVAWIFGLDNITQSYEYMNYYYLVTHTRAAPWLIGLLLGLQLNSLRKSLNKFQNLLISTLWCIAVIILFLICLTTVNIDPNYNKLKSATYVAFSRPLWALAISWVIVACDRGYGGPINAFLSAQIFQIFAKLTYSMYLIHVTMMYSFVFQSKTVYEFSNFAMIHRIWGDCILSMFLAFMMLLTVEYPVLMIEKKVLR